MRCEAAEALERNGGVLQSPTKAKKGRAGEPSSAQVQLAGLLQILKLLGVSPDQAAAAEAEAAPSPSKRRQSKGTPLETPLHPAEVAHVVDGLFEQCAPNLSNFSEAPSVSVMCLLCHSP